MGMAENYVTYSELHKLCNLELTTCCYSLFSALFWIYGIFFYFFLFFFHNAKSRLFHTVVQASIPQFRTTLTLQGNRTCNLDAMVLCSSKIGCLTTREGVECGVLTDIDLQDFSSLYDVTNETAPESMEDCT